jgi:hypothetical protein
MWCNCWPYPSRRERLGHLFISHYLKKAIPTGHVVHSGVSEKWNIDIIYFIFGWAWCGSHKKRARTRYITLVFLHPVHFTGHVICFDLFKAWNINALFFILGWARFDSHKKHDRTPNFYFCISCDLWVPSYVLVHLGRETSTHYFLLLGGLGAGPARSVLGHIMSYLCFYIMWDL